MNHFKLVASIVEKSALRFTPAGIPIATAVLIHHSTQQEATIERQIDMEISAIAAGSISKSVLDIEMGVEMLFTGFLARKNRNSKSLVFHITELQNIQ